MKDTGDQQPRSGRHEIGESVRVSCPHARVVAGCTSFSETRSAAWEAGTGKRQRLKGWSGPGGPKNKSGEEPGLDSGGGAHSHTLKSSRVFGLL